MKEREMKDSGIPWIGEIPKDWEVVHIKHYCNNVYAGGTPQSNNLAYWDGNIPWIPSGSCQNNIITEAPKFITQEGFENSSTKLIPPYTTVMAMTGATCSNTGYVTFQTCMNQSVVAFIQKDGVFSKYLYYTLQAAKQEILTHQTGGAQSGINVEDCKNIIIPFISFEEQKAIAEFLDRKCGEIDELMALQDKMIEELKAYKQSIITETVTKGLNPNVPLKDSGIEWIGEIPQHWKNIRLKEVFRLRTGTTPKDFEKGLDSDSLINWFTPSDIAEMNCELKKSERHLSKDVINKEGILLNPIGTLIFVGIGASAGKIGYSLIESYSNQQITNLIPNEDKIVGKYIYYYLLADRKRIRDNAFFTTLPIINNSYLSSIKILTPPLSEQQEIADYLDKKCSEIDSLIELKQQKIEELKDYKKSIIYEYVTGKKKVS